MLGKSRDVFRNLSLKLRTPKQVQTFLRSMPYNNEKSGETLRSAYCALMKNTSHCYEGAFIAAAILENHGYPPLVMSFESQDGLDHVVYLFKSNGKWGSIGQSRDEGLFGRPPIFRSLRDLAWSYFDPYIDLTGKLTAYQMAHLDDTGADWRNSPRNVWKAEKYLLEIKHRPLKASAKRYKRILSKVKSGCTIEKELYWW